jgi:hypothetical protein
VPAEGDLKHYPQAAVDRRAVRDALVAQGLLEIQPRRRKRARGTPSRDSPAQPASKNVPTLALDNRGAGKIADASTSDPPTTITALVPELNVEPLGIQSHEEAHSSTNKSSASGQH